MSPVQNIETTIGKHHGMLLPEGRIKKIQGLFQADGFGGDFFVAKHLGSAFSGMSLFSLS
jgi:hypothetical protein